MPFLVMVSLLRSLCTVLVPLALLVVLQVWLCKKSRKLGLILPGVTLGFSLLLAVAMLLNVPGGKVVLRDGVTGAVIRETSKAAAWNVSGPMLRSCGVIFLAANIPTVIFGGIWLHSKRRQDALDGLRRMEIEDLE